MNRAHLKAYQKNSLKIYLLTFYQYVFVTCLILNMNSIWMYSPSTEWANDFIVWVTAGTVLISVYVKQKLPIKTLHLSILLAILLTFYWGVFYLIDPLKNNSIFKVFLQVLIIIIYVLFVEKSKNDTLRKLSNVIFVIAIVSIFLWFFGSLTGIIKPTGSIYTTWTGDDSLKKINSYYGIYFETQTANVFGLFSNNLIRNTAIFTEAPMASLIFTVAFLYELLLTQKVNRKRTTILFVAVLSTMSTTGYTAVIIALGLKYTLDKSKMKKTFSLKIFILPFLLSIGGLLLLNLLREKLETSSGSVRIDDFLAGYKAWLDHPIFGNGYENSESYKKYMSAFRRNNLGFSNSPMQILAYGGIYLLIPYLLVTVFATFKFVKREQTNQIAFYLVFIYLFIITVIPFQMLTIYLFISMINTPPEAMLSNQTLVKYNRADKFTEKNIRSVNLNNWGSEFKK